MEKNVYLVLLYEAYKELLTTHKCAIFELYYYSDLSYREIADNKGITYQAVRDTLKKVEKELLEFEEKLGLIELKNVLEKIKDSIDENDLNKSVKSIKKIIKETEV